MGPCSTATGHLHPSHFSLHPWTHLHLMSEKGLVEIHNSLSLTPYVSSRLCFSEWTLLCTGSETERPEMPEKVQDALLFAGRLPVRALSSAQIWPVGLLHEAWSYLNRRLTDVPKCIAWVHKTCISCFLLRYKWNAYSYSSFRRLFIYLNFSTLVSNQFKMCCLAERKCQKMFLNLFSQRRIKTAPGKKRFLSMCMQGLQNCIYFMLRTTSFP